MKKIKENEYIQKFIEIWSVPRYRSIIILCMYFIFFAFVISSVNTNDRTSANNTNKIDVIEEFRKMNNYQYEVTIKNESKKKLVIKVNQNKKIFVYDNINYYYDGNLYKEDSGSYIKVNNDLFEFEFWRFTPKFITDLIKKGELNSKTEYTDGIISKTYLVNCDDFMRLYSGNQINMNDAISITIYQTSKKVIKAELDLTKIYHQIQNFNNYDYTVILEYSSIN